MKILATDLDKTLIPNGLASYDGTLPTLFSKLREGNIYSGFVSGRNLESIKNAIKEYNLKIPHFKIANVGADIYLQRSGDFYRLHEWYDEIVKRNKNWDINKIKRCVEVFPELKLQWPSEQNRFKLSYYIMDRGTYEKSEYIKSQISDILVHADIKHQLIYVKDYANFVMCIDIVSEGVNKLEALLFLKEYEKYDDMIFCGDSENDLSILNSDIKSILVKNASLEVKDKITSKSCYICKGTDKMNGHYSSGILEGLAHYGWI